MATIIPEEVTSHLRRMLESQEFSDDQNENDQKIEKLRVALDALERIKTDDNTDRIRKLEEKPDIYFEKGFSDPQDVPIKTYYFDLQWMSFWVDYNGGKSATVREGSIDFDGRQDPIDVAEGDVVLLGSVCWVCIQHEYGTTSGSPVVIAQATKPTSNETYLIRTLCKFTSTDGGVTYARDFRDVRHTGDIVITALL